MDLTTYKNPGHGQEVLKVSTTTPTIIGGERGRCSVTRPFWITGCDKAWIQTLDHDRTYRIATSPK
ncbi:hypothetical protein Hamer_G016781 [Homarus americanus]|uniref:Uncharacterized protein n=1 Tax=Homarus americanus TaxID=6706 RepID=A0A8J5K0Z9_HOMAM|nr:hypothetical protein Hamer_G016781 [Homarus americanus]